MYSQYSRYQPANSQLITAVMCTMSDRSDDNSLRWRFEASKLLEVAAKLGSKFLDLLRGHLVVIAHEISSATCCHLYHQVEALVNLVNIENRGMGMVVRLLTKSIASISFLRQLVLRIRIQQGGLLCYEALNNSRLP